MDSSYGNFVNARGRSRDSAPRGQGGGSPSCTVGPETGNVQFPPPAHCAIWIAPYDMLIYVLDLQLCPCIPTKPVGNQHYSNEEWVESTWTWSGNQESMKRMKIHHLHHDPHRGRQLVQRKLKAERCEETKGRKPSGRWGEIGRWEMEYIWTISQVGNGRWKKGNYFSLSPWEMGDR